MDSNALVTLAAKPIADGDQVSHLFSDILATWFNTPNCLEWGTLEETALGAAVFAGLNSVLPLPFAQNLTVAKV